MSEEEQIDKSRRCFLLKATTTISGIGLAASSVPFISYWLPSIDTEVAGEPVTVKVSALKPTEQLTISWRGQPIWIIRRTPEMIKNLENPRLIAELLDPNSTTDQQPAYAKNYYRARNAEFAILVGVCTHLGCIPNYRPDIGGISPDWLGGFYCPCHGSKYDLAGRVFKNVPAPLNLVVPPYAFINSDEVMIGVNTIS